MGARAIRIIWAALLASVLIYAFLIFMAVPKAPPAPFQAAFSNPIILILHVIGLMVFFMAFVMSSLLLRRASTPPPPPGTMIISGRVRLALLVRWALMESAAIFGLVAAFLAQDPRLFLALGCLAVIGMLASYPSDDSLRELIGF